MITPPRGLRPQGHSAANRGPLIVQPQQVGVTDARHRDDVHGAVLIVANFRNVVIVGQGGDDDGHRVAVSHDEHSAAAMLAQDAARQPLGSPSSGTIVGLIPSRAANGAAVRRLRRALDTYIASTWPGTLASPSMAASLAARASPAAVSMGSGPASGVLFGVAHHDDGRGIGRCPHPGCPGREDRKAQHSERRQRRQPDGGQERTALETYRVSIHGTIVPMNAAFLPGPQIVILAAGFSSRLGSPKALARVHGVPIAQNAATDGRAHCRQGPDRAAEECLAPAIAGPRAARAFVTNLQPALGLSSSVHCAIARARHSSALLFLPVDLAALRRSDLVRLLSRWRGARRRVTAAHVGFGAGTPLILPHWLYERAMTVSGDKGLRLLVNALPPHQRVLLELRSATADVDTPGDLQTARRRLQSARCDL